MHAIIIRHELASLLGIKDEVRLAESHNKRVAEILKKGSEKRETKWTESIAVGDEQFVLNTETKPGEAAIGRKKSGRQRSYRRC